MNIDELSAGRGIDALIHEKIFERKIFTHEFMMKEALKVWEEQPDVKYFFAGFSAWRKMSGEIVCLQDILPYSTSFPAAMQVWNLFSPITLEKLPLNNEEDTYTCVIPERKGNGWAFHKSIANTEALAICKTVLKVIVGREGDD